MNIQWSLVIFTLLTGAGGCLFAFIGINEFTKWSKKDPTIPSLAAIVLAGVGGLASVTHLSHPNRIMNALSHPTSGIFTEAVLVGLLAVAIVVFVICLKRQISGGVKVFAVLGAILGLLLSYMAGNSYIMAAQTAWNTMLLPLSYLVTALALGGALWWALMAADAENGAQIAGVIVTVCAAVALLVVAAFVGSAGAFSRAVPCAVGVVIGEAVAIIAGLVGRNKNQSVYAWIAVAGACVAALCMRIIMWQVGGGIFEFFM